MRRFGAGFRVARLPRRMNQPGGWPRPETGRPCGVSFDYSVLCALPSVHTGREILWRVNPPGRGLRFERGWARKRWDSISPLSAPGRCAAGAAAGFEHPRGVTPEGSTPSPSAGRDPAGRRGLPDTQVSLGSTPRRPTGAYPLWLITSGKGKGTCGFNPRRPHAPQAFR
jgi:hypothetical protein